MTSRDEGRTFKVAGKKYVWIVEDGKLVAIPYVGSVYHLLDWAVNG